MDLDFLCVKLGNRNSNLKRKGLNERMNYENLRLVIRILEHSRDLVKNADPTGQPDGPGQSWLFLSMRNGPCQADF